MSEYCYDDQQEGGASSFSAAKSKHSPVLSLGRARNPHLSKSIVLVKRLGLCNSQFFLGKILVDHHGDGANMGIVFMDIFDGLIYEEILTFETEIGYFSTEMNLFFDHQLPKERKAPILPFYIFPAFGEPRHYIHE